jgi:uncharacterized protein
MFAGHIGVALALGRAERRVNVGALVAAALLLDIVLWLFVLVGWESVTIPSSFGRTHQPEFVFPYSHSLVASLLWSVLAAVAAWATCAHLGPARMRAAMLVAAAVFSHWLLDALVHRPEMPLFGRASPAMGLALWDHMPLALGVESAIVVLAMLLFIPGCGLPRARSAALVILSLIVLAFTVAGMTLAPPPPSAFAMAGSSLLAIVAVCALFAWLGRPGRVLVGGHATSWTSIRYVLVPWSVAWCLTLAASPTWAGPCEEGQAAFDRVDYPEALKIWHPMAVAGEPSCQFGIGALYEGGLAVAKDDQVAATWFRRAAEQGYAKAQFNLGVMHVEGQGVPRDQWQAVFWFRKAADQDHAKAQFNLGLAYESGFGVSADEQQAVSWYRKSAEHGYAEAEANLGIMYEHGRGVPKDEPEAASWYIKAAEQGLARAQFNLGVMYFEGKGVTKDDRQAAFWFRRAAEQGHGSAQFNLGALYASGRGVPTDDQQAYFWLLLAAVPGDEDVIRVRDVVEQRLTAEQRAVAQSDARDWRPMQGKDSASVRVLPRPAMGGSPDTTGSAFRVSQGRYVTNSHVVDDCSRIQVNGTSDAELLARDSENDLALLTTLGDHGPVASVRASHARLGEAVIVAGFPLHGMLSGLSVTQGNVSGLSGLSGDNNVLSISAPVQVGNSGGPLLDERADVIGMVLAKLDAIRVARLTGDVPQNLNFALDASLVRSFLTENGVGYVEAKAGRPLRPAEIAARAGAFTVLVECWGKH